MALIKKQVFLRSRDENLQQFLAKGDKGYMSLDEQANLSDEDHAEINEQLKNLRGKKPSREYDMETMEGQDAYEFDSEAEGFNKPSPKSEPKSPWDDESDAVAQKAFEVDPEGGAKQYDQKERDAKRQRILDHSWKYVKNLEDQGSDNSNSADDRTQKEFIVEGVQDAYFEKSKGNPGPPGSGKRGRAAYKAGRRKETHERAMDVDQPYREKAAKAKGYLGAEGFATGAARRAIKDFDESEGGRKAFRRWHRAGSAVGERARELDRADTAPYKKLTPEEARERQDQDFDDEAMTIKFENMQKAVYAFIHKRQPPDPEALKALLDAGRISQAGYDAMMSGEAGSAPALDSKANQPTDALGRARQRLSGRKRLGENLRADASGARSEQRQRNTPVRRKIASKPATAEGRESSARQAFIDQYGKTPEEARAEAGEGTSTPETAPDKPKKFVRSKKQDEDSSQAGTQGTLDLMEKALAAAAKKVGGAALGAGKLGARAVGAPLEVIEGLAGSGIIGNIARVGEQAADKYARTQSGAPTYGSKQQTQAVETLGMEKEWTTPQTETPLHKFLDYHKRNQD